MPFIQSGTFTLERVSPTEEAFESSGLAIKVGAFVVVGAATVTVTNVTPTIPTSENTEFGSVELVEETAYESHEESDQLGVPPEPPLWGEKVNANPGTTGTQVWKYELFSEEKEEEPPELENPGTRKSTKGKLISPLKLTAKNTVTNWKATGLPAGLSINESTGEITGTPTTVEEAKVKIKAENAAGTSEEEFEWFIEEPSGHKKNRTYTIL